MAQAPASRFSPKIAPFVKPVSKAKQEQYSLIGAVAVAALIVTLGLCSRYAGWGNDDDHTAFLDDSSSRSLPSPRRAPATYRGESMDYLVPADDAPNGLSAPPVADPYLAQPADTSAQPTAPEFTAPAKRQRLPKRVVAVGFHGGSGLSGGIGKSFQPIFRQALTEDPGGH